MTNQIHIIGYFLKKQKSLTLVIVSTYKGKPVLYLNIKKKMTNKILLTLGLVLYLQNITQAQNYIFEYNNTGARVCLVSSKVDIKNNFIKVIFLDSSLNKSESIYVNRRKFGSHSWTNVASDLTPGTGHWIDKNVSAGDIWEYQVKRKNTWSYESANYDATGYTIGCLQSDNTGYKGQMILLVADDVPTNLPAKYVRLKKEITEDGWYVNELIVSRATNWDSGDKVVTIKNQVKEIYNNAPADDKPKVLFIFGHVPLPRSGSSADAYPPDMHASNQGARGCDAYYADIDGTYTDVATFNPGTLATTLAINLPGDYKWDQDFFPSDIEMAFGRIDFADITDISTNEFTLLGNYLDRLSNYKNVASIFKMIL